MTDINIANIGATVTSAIGVAAAVSAVLPRKGPPWYIAILSVIDVLGANVANAKNAPAVVNK